MRILAKTAALMLEMALIQELYQFLIFLCFYSDHYHRVSLAALSSFQNDIRWMGLFELYQPIRD